MHRYYLQATALAGFLAVAFGAFGAHALRGRLDEHSLSIYQTGVQYHFWHALALGLIAVLAQQAPSSKLLLWSGRLMLAGLLLFSGSLYALALSGNTLLGMVTPFGGVAFLLGWGMLGGYGWSLGRTP